MAQESVNSMVTPKVTQPDGAQVRKNSTGKQYPSKSAQNLSLRSTSSCHDFCKYGKKHEFETKARSPAQKKGTAPKIFNRSSVQGVIVTERKQIEVGKVRPGSHYKSSFDVLSLVKTVEVPTTTFSKSAVSLKPKSVTRMPPSVAKSAGGLSISKYSDFGRGETIRTKRIEEKPSAPSTVALPFQNSRTSVSSGTQKHSILKVVAPRDVIRKIEPKQLSKDKNEEKKVHTFFQAARSLKQSLIGVASLNPREKKSLEVAAPLKHKKAVGETDSNQFGKDKNNETSRGMKNVVAVCPLKIQNYRVECMEDSYNGQRPLQAVIETKTAEEALASSKDGILPLESAVSISTKSSLSDSNYQFMSTPDEKDLQAFVYSSEADGYTSEDGTADLNTIKSTLEPEDSRVCRNSTIPLSSKEEGSASTKMMFRRGKIIEIKTEDTGPRRLKFRQGRLFEWNHKVGSHDRQKHYKRRGRADCPANGNASSEEVVLRHQDAQGKKDEQVLLNNVIEEIASRLEQTRKSKVKALLGAFESVISLQENHSYTGIVM